VNEEGRVRDDTAASHSQTHVWLKTGIVVLISIVAVAVVYAYRLR
jgi:hypothetical protein